MPASTPSLLDHFDKIAVIAGGLFAGTALYISVGEVPAIGDLGVDTHWRFFSPMYKRAAPQQTFLTGAAGLTGILYGMGIKNAPFYRNLWIAAGTAFIGIIPYTVIFMFPTNYRIIADSDQVNSGGQSKIDGPTKEELLKKWACLHWVRTATSVAAFGAMVFGLKPH